MSERAREAAREWMRRWGVEVVPWWCALLRERAVEGLTRMAAWPGNQMAYWLERERALWQDWELPGTVRAVGVWPAAGCLEFPSVRAVEDWAHVPKEPYWEELEARGWARTDNGLLLVPEDLAGRPWWVVLLHERIQDGGADEEFRVNGRLYSFVRLDALWRTMLGLRREDGWMVLWRAPGEPEDCRVLTEEEFDGMRRMRDGGQGA